ncbi:carbohydrate sulfotransferase 15-like [Liolophura sinensis]|uniref:carbohydrate sulfotransferase 15-like n=1 Tax=Liolophura sinensis TaxID=3198878 RepID=UPI003159103B
MCLLKVRRSMVRTILSQLGGVSVRARRFFLVLCLAGAVGVFCLHNAMFSVKTWMKKDVLTSGTIVRNSPRLTSTISRASDEPSNSTIGNGELYDSDILSTRPINYLHSFKNPCWHERLKYGSNVTESRGNFHCLPYFFIAGFAKCASTDLYYRVIAHPEVVPPRGKECHWWTRERFDPKSSLRSFEDYLSFLQPATDQIFIESERQHNKFNRLVTVDASGSTLWDNFYWREIPENDASAEEPRFRNSHCLKHILPKAKFIVLLRNPTERMWSEYLYLSPMYGKNLSAVNFHDRAVESVTTFKLCLQTRSLNACLYDKDVINTMRLRLHVGLYGPYIRRWLQVYPPDQCLFLQTEDYSKNLRQSLKRVFSFLDLVDLSDTELDNIVSMTNRNQRFPESQEIGDMWNVTHQLLDQFYEASNRELASILQDDRYLWKSN